MKKSLKNYGQDIIMAFSPPVVGCLAKKACKRGGSRAPQDPPGYALVASHTRPLENVMLLLLSCLNKGSSFIISYRIAYTSCVPGSTYHTKRAEEPRRSLFGEAGL